MANLLRYLFHSWHAPPPPVMCRREEFLRYGGTLTLGMDPEHRARVWRAKHEEEKQCKCPQI